MCYNHSVGLDNQKLQIGCCHGTLLEDQEKDLVQAMTTRPRIRTSQTMVVTVVVERVVVDCCNLLRVDTAR